MENNKKIMNYFESILEYPNDITENILEYNILWNYIASTFLNGFINYTRPLSCYVLDRYCLSNDTDRPINVKVFNKNEYLNWYEWTGTKEEYIDAIVNEKIKTYHTDLGSFKDDIVVLSKICENKYMFFYFDCDVSDCCIGRFETNDDENIVIESVENWLNEEKNDPHSEIFGYNKIPVSFLCGWISF